MHLKQLHFRRSHAVTEHKKLVAECWRLLRVTYVGKPTTRILLPRSKVTQSFVPQEEKERRSSQGFKLLEENSGTTFRDSLSQAKSG